MISYLISSTICRVLRVLTRFPRNNVLAKKVTTIIVSPGKVAAGELLACGVAYANGIIVPIKRKEATSAELDDERCLVLGIGRRHQPELANFDLRDNGKTVPAYTQLSKYLNNDFAGEWFKVVATYEQYGPTGFKNGAEVKAIYDTPLLKLLCRDWESPVRRVLLASRLAKVLKTELADYKRFEQLAKVVKVAGFTVGDFTEVPQELMYARSAFVRNKEIDCTLSISRKALAFCSLVFDRLDFSRCSGKPYVEFVHPRGSYLTVRDGDRSIIETVLKDAMCERSN